MESETKFGAERLTGDRLSHPLHLRFGHPSGSGEGFIGPRLAVSRTRRSNSRARRLKLDGSGDSILRSVVRLGQSTS